MSSSVPYIFLDLAALIYLYLEMRYAIRYYENKGGDLKNKDELRKWLIKKNKIEFCIIGAVVTTTTAILFYRAFQNFSLTNIIHNITG